MCISIWNCLPDSVDFSFLSLCLNVLLKVKILQIVLDITIIILTSNVPARGAGTSTPKAMTTEKNPAQ